VPTAPPRRPGLVHTHHGKRPSRRENLSRGVLANMSHVPESLELLVLPVNAGGDRVTLIAQDEVADTAERSEVGSRQQ
jgi:hypothetical protein